jgi:choline kinase
MKAIILAAGRGSRLHPYTTTAPKCLTELGGMTLIERQLRTLRNGGVKDIVIITGYKSNQLKLHNTRQIYNPLWETTNMVESLFCAESEFKNDLIVSYSDIVYEPSVLSALLLSNNDISVVVDRKWRTYWEYRFDDPLSDAESLKIDSSGLITDIGASTDDINSIEAQYIGLMRFRNKGIDAIKNAKSSFQTQTRPWMVDHPIEKAYMTDLLMEMILMGYPVTAVPIDNGWLEVDTVNDYESLAQDFKTGNITNFFNPHQS